MRMISTLLSAVVIAAGLAWLTISGEDAKPVDPLTLTAPAAEEVKPVEVPVGEVKPVEVAPAAEEVKPAEEPSK